MKEKGRFMTPLQLKDSLLGFLPNLTERRTIVQQRSVKTLENMFNYASLFESNEDKVQAAFDRREHIVRLIYTDDYLKNGQESKIDHPDFNVTHRNYNLKTKEPLISPKDNYWINNNSVTKTEYEFGQYLIAHFESLENVVNYAVQENIAIQQTIADKEARLQELNNRRIAEEEAQKLNLQQQVFDEMSKGYKKVGNENPQILEEKRQSTLDFSAFEDEGYERTGDLTRAIYILPEGDLWSGYYSEAPEVRAIEHREIEGFVRDENIDRDSNGFWKEILKEVVMVIPEKETLLLLNGANYDDGQKERLSDYQELGWNITNEDPKLTVSDGQEIIQDELDEERVMDNNLKIVNSTSGSALENKVEKVDFNFESITEEIFNEQKEQLVMKWEDFKTPTGETDANEAFGALVQDVWDAKYRYATLDEKDKLEKWLDGYYDHFYEGGREAYEQALKAGGSEGYIINYNEKAIDQFVSLYDQHLLELEKLQSTGLKRKDKLDIPEEFLSMLQDGEDTRKIRVGEAFYTFSIEDQNMDQRGKQKIFLRLNSHDGSNVQEEVFQKIFGTGSWIVNHNFDSKIIYQMNEHPLIEKELHERVQRQLPVSVTAPRTAEKVEPLGESMSKDTYEITYKNKSKNTEANEKSNASMDLAQEAMQKIKNYSQDPKEMKEYLDFMSKFPQFSPRNTALLHEQWQGANVVATYDQWRGKATDPAKNMPQVLDIKPTDIEQIKGSVTDLKTDVTKKKDMGQLSVRLGEKSQIKLLRPVAQEYILKERDGKIQPYFKKYWSKEEKEKVKSGDIPVKKKTSYVPQAYFEISQTNIKSESLPKMMPNRHINFDLNPKLAIAMQKGLEIYAQDEAKVQIEMTELGDNRLGNAKGAYYPSSEKIRLNHLNTPSENVPVLIHELTHATLHKEGNTNKMSSEYANQELEAELTAYVVSKRYGLDTEKESLSYIAKWTNNAKSLSDKELSASLSHVQKTADKMTAYIDTQLDPALKLSQQQVQIKAHAIERTQATPSFKPLGLTR
ncbi:zincin-like metallopeptidase domain-containing protein [Lactococcus lactis]|uniref:zincin-like metallopeptidase domain-containing protein n=1 Tax=Lactococcus lactis TaxID=1358 RepID=UPI0025A0B327|nr:zincin-like metallopeptidase domain-containing protein [Lactococcus lactis]MDM7536362.1 zincin-like metallopeptidase domain-containing protein [Lactococcus lactis]